MSVLFAPNSHVPHWSELVVLQTNPIQISYIRKSFGVLEPFLTEYVFRCGDGYIDLFNTYLFVEAQIVNTGGSNLEPDTDVGPVDLWMHSLFSDVSVSLNEKLVSPPTNMYPYRAYIETLLSYGPAAK
jgi:hypothetical protein